MKENIKKLQFYESNSKIVQSAVYLIVFPKNLFLKICMRFFD